MPNSSPALEIASLARRYGLVAALRSRPNLDFEHLYQLLHEGKYAADLRRLRVSDLLGQPALSLDPLAQESVARSMMRIFNQAPSRWFASSYFVHHLGLKRWTAQQKLAELAELGSLERRGVTSGTRYRLANSTRRRTER